MTLAHYLGSLLLIFTLRSQAIGGFFPFRVATYSEPLDLALQGVRFGHAVAPGTPQTPF